MQEEALDFSLKHVKSLTPTEDELPKSTSAIILSQSCFDQSVASRIQMLEHMNPFAVLTSSGSVGVPGISPQGAHFAMVSSQLLPTTSLAITALQRRRRRTSTKSNEEIGVGKKIRSIPEERKDDAYWERRRKNNEAAKRSRDARKAKEDEIAFRAAYLEQENLKLKAQLTTLKSELARLQSALFSNTQ